MRGPANVFFGRLSNPGKLEKIDFEDETQETFGVGKIEDFRQNQLIDLYACVECGVVQICVRQQEQEKCYRRWT